MKSALPKKLFIESLWFSTTLMVGLMIGHWVYPELVRLIADMKVAFFLYSDGNGSFPLPAILLLFVVYCSRVFYQRFANPLTFWIFVPVLMYLMVSWDLYSWLIEVIVIERSYDLGWTIGPIQVNAFELSRMILKFLNISFPILLAYCAYRFATTSLTGSNVPSPTRSTGNLKIEALWFGATVIVGVFVSRLILLSLVDVLEIKDSDPVYFSFFTTTLVTVFLVCVFAIRNFRAGFSQTIPFILFLISAVYLWCEIPMTQMTVYSYLQPSVEEVLAETTPKEEAMVGATFFLVFKIACLLLIVYSAYRFGRSRKSAPATEPDVAVV